MRRGGFLLGIVLFALMLGISVTAADPAIAVAATRRDANGAIVVVQPVTDKQGNIQPPIALLGEYVIANGVGFVPNQPVQAYLIVGGQAMELAYQDLTTSVTARQPVPKTDSAGNFQQLAFTLPVPGSVTGTTGEIRVSVGSATASAPVSLDTGVGSGDLRGDRIAVSIGAAFAAIALIVIFLLLRGLPIYPATRMAARDADTA